MNHEHSKDTYSYDTVLAFLVFVLCLIYSFSDDLVEIVNSVVAALP